MDSFRDHFGPRLLYGLLLRRSGETSLSTCLHPTRANSERPKSPCYKKCMVNAEELKSLPRLSRLSDDELLRRLSDVLAQSRRVESVLVAHIAEVDARRLFAREVAEIAPKPDVPSVIRKLPSRQAKTATQTRNEPSDEAGPDGVGQNCQAPPPAPAPEAPEKPAFVEPLSPARYKVQFTASAEFRDKSIGSPRSCLTWTSLRSWKRP